MQTIFGAEDAAAEAKSALNILEKQSVRSILIALLVFVIGWFLIKYFVRLLEKVLTRRAALDASVRGAILSVCRGVLVFVLLLTCADRLGLPTTSLITLLGTLGLALSLAMQSSLANLAGGLFIMTTKPFVTGDFIDVAGQSGTVSKIGFIHTMLNTLDNKQIFIPNGTVSSSVVVNYSHEPRRQLDLDIPVPYECSLAAARAAIEQAVAAEPRVLEAPYIRTWALSASSVTVKVRVWCAAAEYFDLRAALLEGIKRALDDAHISIPYEQLDVHIKQ